MTKLGLAPPPPTPTLPQKGGGGDICAACSDLAPGTPFDRSGPALARPLSTRWSARNNRASRLLRGDRPEEARDRKSAARARRRTKEPAHAY